MKPVREIRDGDIHIGYACGHCGMRHVDCATATPQSEYLDSLRERALRCCVCANCGQALSVPYISSLCGDCQKSAATVLLKHTLAIVSSNDDKDTMLSARLLVAAGHLRSVFQQHGYPDTFPKGLR